MVEVKNNTSGVVSNCNTTTDSQRCHKTISYSKRNLLLFLIAIFSFLTINIINCIPVSALDNYSLSLTTNNANLTKDIQALPQPIMHILKHNITVSTSNPSGFRLFLSSKDTSTAPVNTNPTPGTFGTMDLSATIGTVDNPAKLNVNTFGFAIPNDIANPNPLVQHFSAHTTYESNEHSIKEQSLFAGIPDKDHPALIYYNTSNIPSNNTIPVYYGSFVDGMLKEGTHKLDVLYTVVSNPPADTFPATDDRTIEISPKRLAIKEEDGNFYKDQIITIKTNLKSNQSLDKSDINLTINNKPCTDINITENWNSTTTNKFLTLTCKAPTNPATKQGIKYDINLKIDKYGINLTKQQAVLYVIPEPMQSFTSQMCASMNEHDEKYIIDTRDNELYTTTKLKDGKCWMTENLRLKLDKNTTLTPNDTNVKDNWTPSNSTGTNPSDIWVNEPWGSFAPITMRPNRTMVCIITIQQPPLVSLQI